MSRFRAALTGSAIVLGSSAVLLTGGIAKADPVVAPAPVPGIPGMNMIQGLMDPSKLPQILQAATSAMSAAPAALLPSAVQPAVPSGLIPNAPLASALPQTMTGVTAPPLPAALTTVPATGNTFLPAAAPTAGLPSIPGLPAPISQYLALPGDLAALMPGAPGAVPITQPGLAPAAAANSPAPGLGVLFPTSALP